MKELSRTDGSHCKCSQQVFAANRVRCHVFGRSYRDYIIRVLWEVI